jgi:peptidoglycan/xylan/chitin deacetylase (PgdA/CDA1 family)
MNSAGMSLRRKARLLILKGSKTLGLFRISQALTRKKLRILCYHNFALADVPEWEKLLTMDARIFEERMAYLAEHGHTVLGLDEGVDGLDTGALPDLPTVITIDDGWFNIKRYAHGILKRHEFPHTIYVSSHYSRHQVPLFNISIQYLFEMTRKRTVELDGLNLPFDANVDLSDEASTEETKDRIIDYGHTQLNPQERRDFLLRAAELLEVDFRPLDYERAYHFVSASEIRELVADGVDIQMHAYRHVWPMDRERALKELADDRAYLEPLVGKTLHHFCYPSGIYDKSQFPFLSEAKVKSATTCESGFNDADTHKFALKRFLDSDDIHALEFEAEMAGYLELMRKLRNPLRELTALMADLPRLPDALRPDRSDHPRTPDAGCD